MYMHTAKCKHTIVLYMTTPQHPPASFPLVQDSAINHGYTVLSCRPNQALCSLPHRVRMKGFGGLKPKTKGTIARIKDCLSSIHSVGRSLCTAYLPLTSFTVETLSVP